MSAPTQTRQSPARVGARSRALMGSLSSSTKLALACLLVIVLCAVLGPLLWPLEPLALTSDVFRAPSLAHPLGTDDLGRDMFARVLSGARVTLLVGTVSALISAVIGTVIGAIAAYAGGVVDDVLMRFTELFQVIPRFLLAIVIVAIFGGGEVVIVPVIGLLSWIGTARIVRSRIMVLKNEEFVLAAIMGGASAWRVVTRHILPNVASYLIVSVCLQMGAAILIESSLSFVGLGDPLKPSWGLLLQQAQIYLQTAWWLTVFPGLALSSTILCLNVLGDGLSAGNDLSRARH
ncbi:peptide/nickel transport system permease protein [Caballeronia udeis]|uniref:Peptide/nickel transport system permease protein n=1 Tax=Caballeronia udeis TaxID=1232866 RepID=A0ABW8MUC0_9BURK